MSNLLDNEFGFSSLGGGGGGDEGSILGDGFADEVAFFYEAEAIEGNNFLFFRNSVVRLSIGDSSVATQTLDVTGTTQATSFSIVSGGTFTSPSAGNVNITAKLGLTTAVGIDPTEVLDVDGNITLRADFGGGHIDGYSTVLNEIYSIGRTDTPSEGSLSINSRSAINFGEGSATLGGSQTMLLYDTGNVVIQNGGSFTDTGERLKVTGNVSVPNANLVTTNSTNVLRGSGATAATNVFRLFNSAGTQTFQFRNDGRWFLGIGSTNVFFSPMAATTTTSITGVNLRIVANGGAFASPQGAYNFSTEEAMTQTSGTAVGVDVNIGFAPTSGSATFAALQTEEGISQSGGANGITRGVYISPTLTASADFRAIETNINTQVGAIRYQFYFNGSAASFFNCDIVFDTATGSKIGTGTTQRLAFWNKTSIIQPTTGVASAVYAAVGGSNIQTDDTFDAFTFAQIVKALRNLGLLA